jgi:uncharacterized membrane protein YhhN
MKKISLIVFILALTGVLIGESIQHELLYVISKPLILISLICYYYFSLASQYRSTLLLLALMLSLAGDLLLLKADYFIPGLIAFLCAHVAYIFVYRQHQQSEQQQSLQGIHRMRMAFPIILAGSGLVVVLYPKLGDLRIPVMIYALVITIMALTALFRYGRTTSESFWLVFFGAILFMLSDSVLAINKFLTPFNYAGIYIMLTYSIGQFLIVQGLIKHPQEN